MDLFTTFVNLAGGSIPDDRVIDGIDLTSSFFSNTVQERYVYLNINSLKGSVLIGFPCAMHHLLLWFYLQQYQLT